MFEKHFQGSPAFEILSPQGANPTRDWKVVGVQRLFDKALKGYVFHVTGGASMRLPREDKPRLGLVQPILVLQVYLPQGKPFSVEISITDQTRTRRRLLFSSSFKDVCTNPLHARFPLIDSSRLLKVQRNCWVSLCFDIEALVPKAWPTQHYKTLDSLQISSDCRLRKVYTLRGQPLAEENLLRLQDGTTTIIQVIDGSGPGTSDEDRGDTTPSCNYTPLPGAPLAAATTECFGYDELVRRNQIGASGSGGGNISWGHGTKTKAQMQMIDRRSPKGVLSRDRFRERPNTRTECATIHLGMRETDRTVAEKINGRDSSAKDRPDRTEPAFARRLKGQGSLGRKDKRENSLPTGRTISRKDNDRLGHQTPVNHRFGSISTMTSLSTLHGGSSPNRKKPSTSDGQASPTRRRARPSQQSPYINVINNHEAVSSGANLPVRLSQRTENVVRSMRYSSEPQLGTGAAGQEAWDDWEEAHKQRGNAVPTILESPTKLLEGKEKELSSRLKRLAVLEKKEMQALTSLEADDVVNYGEPVEGIHLERHDETTTNKMRVSKLDHIKEGGKEGGKCGRTDSKDSSLPLVESSSPSKPRTYPSRDERMSTLNERKGTMQHSRGDMMGSVGGSKTESLPSATATQLNGVLDGVGAGPGEKKSLLGGGNGLPKASLSGYSGQAVSKEGESKSQMPPLDVAPTNGGGLQMNDTFPLPSHGPGGTRRTPEKLRNGAGSEGATTSCSTTRCPSTTGTNNQRTPERLRNGGDPEFLAKRSTPERLRDSVKTTSGNTPERQKAAERGGASEKAKDSLRYNPQESLKPVEYTPGAYAPARPARDNDKSKDSPSRESGMRIRSSIPSQAAVAAQSSQQPFQSSAAVQSSQHATPKSTAASSSVAKPPHIDDDFRHRFDGFASCGRQSLDEITQSEIFSEPHAVQSFDGSDWMHNKELSVFDSASGGNQGAPLIPPEKGNPQPSQMGQHFSSPRADTKNIGQTQKSSGSQAGKNNLPLAGIHATDPVSSSQDIHEESPRIPPPKDEATLGMNKIITLEVTAPGEFRENQPSLDCIVGASPSRGLIVDERKASLELLEQVAQREESAMKKKTSSSYMKENVKFQDEVTLPRLPIVGGDNDRQDPDPSEVTQPFVHFNEPSHRLEPAQELPLAGTISRDLSGGDTTQIGSPKLSSVHNAHFVPRPRPFTPPVVPVYQLLKNPIVEAPECIEVMFDPLLDIYYDPVTNKYYELKDDGDDA